MDHSVRGNDAMRGGVSLDYLELHPPHPSPHEEDVSLVHWAVGFQEVGLEEYIKEITKVERGGGEEGKKEGRGRGREVGGGRRGEREGKDGGRERVGGVRTEERRGWEDGGGGKRKERRGRGGEGQLILACKILLQ